MLYLAFIVKLKRTYNVQITSYSFFLRDLIPNDEIPGKRKSPFYAFQRFVRLTRPLKYVFVGAGGGGVEGVVIEFQVQFSLVIHL